MSKQTLSTASCIIIGEFVCLFGEGQTSGQSIFMTDILYPRNAIPQKLQWGIELISILTPILFQLPMYSIPWKTKQIKDTKMTEYKTLDRGAHFFKIYF